MPKHKPGSGGRTLPPDQRQQGLRAFQAGRFDAAIAAWRPLAASDPPVARALAEAYFRRALSRGAMPTNPIADLGEALRLASDQLRYRYHLGLALHRSGDPQAAAEQYRAVLAHDGRWPGAAHLLALATLEREPQADLRTLPGSTPTVQAALAPVQALLRSKQPPSVGDDPTGQLWRGLGLIHKSDPSTTSTLDDQRPLTGAGAMAVRRYYRGVAAAQNGDWAGALHAWLHVEPERFGHPWLRANLVAATARRLDEVGSDDLTSAAETALRAVPFAGGNVALGEALLQALDRAAYAAAEVGDWDRAAACWEGARSVLSGNSTLGSPRPILHNLALVHENQEQWMEAAAAWRAMLRTRPRRTANAATDSTGLTDSQWGWVRRRVIECYKRADAPHEAVTVFRQLLKAEPDDLDLRLQLVDALLANDQEQAALNELQRILQIDANHIDAKLRYATLRLAQNFFEQDEGAHILREIVAQHPERDDARRVLAQHLRERGNEFHQWGKLDQAEELYREGQAIVPDDFQFPLNLARIAIDRKQLEQAQPLVDRALELGNDQPEAYMLVIEVWVAAEKIDTARAVLERAEGALSVTPIWYIDLGVVLLRRDKPMPALPSLFGPPPKPTKPKDTPASRFASEVLDRAISRAPEAPPVQLQIAAALMFVRADLALGYAETAQQALGDQANAVLIYGLALALNERNKEAKNTLRRAAKLAKQQNQPEVAQHAEALLQQVGSPFLHMSLQMAEFGDDLDDFDDAGNFWP